MREKWSLCIQNRALNQKYTFSPLLEKEREREKKRVRGRERDNKIKRERETSYWVLEREGER